MSVIPSPSTSSAVSSINNQSTQWINVQKNIGPLSLQRVGINYQNEFLWFVLDASLTTAPLNFSLTGLSVGVNISDSGKGLDFTLEGLDVEFNSDDIVINRSEEHTSELHS